QGFLFLGTSENISQHVDLFTPVDKKNRIFQRREDSITPLHLPAVFKRPFGVGAVSEATREPVGRSLRQSVEARVLEHHVPAHVVVTRDGDVVYYSGGTGKYLEPPPGRPNRSLIAMARKGLRLPLRAALNDAIETRRAAVRDNVAVEVGDHAEYVK